ncbi:MAG: glycerophosphodiester phosphodiesterase family protein [Parvularculaceae bacterium]|nr:glycerophosphodiester phosphodiesterase family protein [Parvularculaceae bacterium]
MRRTVFALLATLAGCATPKETAVRWPTLDGKPPLIIAHRGSSGYLPEHTLEAYGLAIEQGADVIEPDLVFTKDGVLVARHDRYLSTTTNVADKPEFASRKRPNADPSGEPREDWWVEDFTLAELKTLRARQPFPGRTKEHDDKFLIPTFDEVLAFVTTKAKEASRPVGVYPETKHPAYFASIGRDFEAPFLKALAGFDAGPVFIQSFEPEILKRLKGKTTAKLVQLVFEETPGAGPNIPLEEIATYADGVGPAKALVSTPPPATLRFRSRVRICFVFSSMLGRFVITPL